MTTIQDLRKQTGSEYDDLSDEQFAEGLWNKYQSEYQDFTKEEFLEKVGALTESQPPEEEPDPEPIEPPVAPGVLGTFLSGVTTEQKTPTQAQAFGQRMVEDFASVPIDTLRGTAELADVATNFVGLEDVISDDSALKKYAKNQKEYLREIYEVNDAYKDTWATDFGGALGSMAAFMLGGAASRGLGYGVATTSGAGRGSERIDAARESGVDVSQGQEDLGVFLHSLVGASEMLPIQNIFKRIPGDIDASLKRKIFNRLKEIGASGLLEGVQEQTASILDDAIEANVYNPDLNIEDSLYGKMTNLDPEFFKDVFTSREATVSFAAGAIADFSTGLLQGVGRGKRFDINEKAQKEYEENLRETKDKAVEDIAESVSVAKGDSLPEVDLDVELNLNILNERINELEASDKVFKTEETNKELEFLKARRRDLLRVQAMDSTIEYIKRKKDVSPDQIDLLAEEQRQREELIAGGATEAQANEIILGPTVSARGRDPIQRSAVHVAKTIGPDFATIEGEFEVVEGSIETDQNGQPQRKYEVVVGGQRFGQPLNSYEDAAKFASVLSDQRKKAKINNSVSQQIVSDGQPLTTDDTKTMASYGVTVLDPEQTTFTSSAVNLAGNTTVDRGYDETASLLDQRKKNLPVSKYTVAQKINANREKKGLLPANSFTVEEAREVLGKNFGNLGDPKINTTLETETYQVDRESDGKIVVVSSNGQRFRGKRLTAKEYQDQLEAGKRPDKNKKYPFKTQREARAFAEKLNKNRGTAAVPEEVLHEDLQSALESKNISSKADSPEVNTLVSKIVGKKVSKTSDLTSGEKKLVLSKIRSLPKFSRPTKLINFSKDPAPETTQETQQETLALPGPSTDIQQAREAVDAAMNEVGLSDVKANVDYALRNVRRDRNGNLVYGIRQRGANEEGVETFGGEGSPLVVDGTTPDGDGFYSDATGQIFLALDRVSPDLPIEERIDQIVEILTHEQIHAMRALDLFTDAEWRLLTKTAKQRNKAPGQTYFEWAQQNYPEFGEVDQVEESIAELVRDARAGKGAFSGKNKLSGKPKTLVQRIINFVKGMANVIDGVGFKTFEELVSSIESGEVGARERGQMRSARELERQGIPPDVLFPMFGDTSPDEITKTKTKDATTRRPDFIEPADIIDQLTPGDPNSNVEMTSAINDRMSRQGKFELNVRVPKIIKKAYKLFRVKDPKKIIVDEDKMTVEVKDDASFYPLFVDSDQEVVTDEWVAAKSGEATFNKMGEISGVKSSIGVLDYRPGHHSSDQPAATHIGGKAAVGDGQVNYRKANQVWAEVEVGADQHKKWAKQARENGFKEVIKNGRIESPEGVFSAKHAELKELPELGYYRYKTNPNMQGNWLISGEVKIIGKALTPKQLERIRNKQKTEDVPLLPEVIKKRKLGIKDLTGESIKELKTYYPKTLKKLLPKYMKYVDSLSPKERRSSGAKKQEDKGVLPSLQHVDLYQQNIKDRFSRADVVPIRDRFARKKPTNIISLLKGQEAKPELPKSRGKVLKRDAALFLQNRSLDKLGGIPRDISIPEDREAIADQLVEEGLYEMDRLDNAVDWYDQTIAEMIEMMSIKHPEIITDPDARTALFISLAITSQQMAVKNNLRLAEKAYSHYAKRGRFPIIGEGKSSKVMKTNFKKANELIKKLGSMQNLAEFLKTEFTVKELNAELTKHIKGEEIGGENVDTIVFGSAVFGPKIGQGFYQNLTGNFSPVTMDMWFMRTIGRLSGDLMNFDEDLLAKQRVAFIKSANLPKNISNAKLIEKADEIRKENDRLFRKFGDEFKSGKREKTQAAKDAQAIIKNVKDTKDTPASGGERNNLREIVRIAVDKLNKRTGQNVPPAAFQALIWYPEQDLYRDLGVQQKDERADYANATKELLIREGFSEKEIDQRRDRVRLSPEFRSGRVQQDARESVTETTGRPGERLSGTVQQEEESTSPVVKDRFSREFRDNQKKLRIRTPAKIKKAVEQNLKEFETRSTSNAVPRFSIIADPEVQYVGRNPEQALTPSPEILDRFARDGDPGLSKQAKEIINRVIKKAEAGKTVAETFIEVTNTDWRTYFKTKLRQEVIFNYAELERLYNKGDLEFGDFESSAFVALIMADASRAFTSDAFTMGRIEYDQENGIATTVPFMFKGEEIKGLFGVFKPLYVNPYGASLEPLAAALFAAERAKRLEKEGKATPFKTGKEGEKELEIIQNEVNKFINPETGVPIIREVQEVYRAYNEYTIKWLEDTGVIDSEIAQTWREYADFVPFYREAEGEEMPAEFPSVFGGMTSAAKLEPLKGSERSLTVPLFDAVSRNLSMAIDLGMKNIAQQRVIRDMIEAGMAREILPGENQAKVRIVSLRVDGKKREFTVDDPLVYESLLPAQTLDSPFIKMLGFPSTVMRELITRSPSFVAKNTIRDSVGAFVTSGANYLPLAGIVKGFTTGMSELRKYGAVGGYDNVREKEGIHKQMRKFLRREGQMPPKYEIGVPGEDSEISRLYKRYDNELPFVNNLIAFWDLTGDITTMSDATVRKNVFDDTLARTGSLAAAVFAAKEVMNFGRRGRNAYVQAFTTAVPFLNPRYQGLDLIYRSHTGTNLAMVGKDGKPMKSSEQMIKAITRGVMLSTAALIMWALSNDDDQWKETPDEIKDINIVVPTRFGVPFLFPVPFEVGLFYQTMPMRIFDYYFGSEGKTTKTELADSVARFAFGTAEGLVFNPASIQLIAPLYEALNNKNTFTRRQIVPQYVLDTTFPEYQQTPYTTEIAKAISKAMNLGAQATGIKSLQDASSPMLIDHVMKGYFPGIGNYLIGMADALAKSDLLNEDNKKAIPENALDFANQDWWDYPFINKFFRDKFDSGAKQDFYQLKSEFNKAAQAINDDKIPVDKRRALAVAYHYLLEPENEARIKKVDDALKEARDKIRFLAQTDMPLAYKKNQIRKWEEVAASYNHLIYSIKDTTSLPGIRPMGGISEEEYTKFKELRRIARESEKERRDAPVYKGRE